MTEVLTRNGLSNMANVINNTDLDKVSQTIANGKKDNKA